MRGSESETRGRIEVLVLAALAVFFFVSAAYVPVIGILISLLAPTPILLATLRHGFRMGLLTVGLSVLFLALLFGGPQSLIFCAEYGVMAVVMAEAVRRQWSAEKILATATAAALVASGLVIAVLLASADPDLSALQRYFENNLGQALRPYVGEGETAVSGEFRAHLQDTLNLVVRMLPALFVISTAAGALVNYSVARLVWRRLAGPPLFPDISLPEWRAPEVCVWVLIGGGILSFVPIPSLQILGLNVLLLVGLVYLIQGLGIMVFYLRRASVPPLFRGLAYVFLLVQPFLLLGVAAFGLFDLWFDFRRTRNKREELQ